MGLTIHWSFQGPQSKTEATTIIGKLRQRAMDLPFESVGDIVRFKGKDAQFDHDPPDSEYLWLKIQARETIWTQDGRIGWDCPAQEIIGFQVNVAPGSEWMEIFLATYPKTLLIEDDRTGKPKRLRTNLAGWSGRGFCKTQYASDDRCGGVPNFLRAHLSVCRLLDHAKELGILKEISDEGEFFVKRDIPALVNTIANWNAFIAAGVGAFDELVGDRATAPIKDFPDFERLEQRVRTKSTDFFGRSRNDGMTFAKIDNGWEEGGPNRRRVMCEDFDDIPDFDDDEDSDDDDWEDFDDDLEDEK